MVWPEGMSLSSTGFAVIVLLVTKVAAFDFLPRFDVDHGNADRIVGGVMDQKLNHVNSLLCL